MRRFRLTTIERVHSNVSNMGRVEQTRCVAEGVVFHDGSAAMRWLGETPSTAFYADLETLRKIHHVIPHPVINGPSLTDGVCGGSGEIGQRYIVWEDPICFACGAVLFYDERVASHCYGCGAGQSKAGYFGDRPDSPLGSWAPALSLGPA